jgi:hypothetical protein
LERPGNASRKAAALAGERARNSQKNESKKLNEQREWQGEQLESEAKYTREIRPRGHHYPGELIHKSDSTNH